VVAPSSGTLTSNSNHVNASMNNRNGVRIVMPLNCGAMAGSGKNLTLTDRLRNGFNWVACCRIARFRTMAAIALNPPKSCRTAIHPRSAMSKADA
jgi:hypothetical protein